MRANCIRARKSRPEASSNDWNNDDDNWFHEDISKAFKEMKNMKLFDVEDTYLIDDAWDWTWEREIKKRPL
ncbi:unnamed protein product [Dovyalis caffra]|uniref:Uncharacterized protein n=1 Tax=Dovyalis caffra TaxID=77055 RepID=A0AAV1S1A2_9ROSI|nr:unnamed protein product [Dovyalis caffra]